MPNIDICLVVADPALRAALAEQLDTAAPAGAGLREMAGLPSSFSEIPDAIIIDAPLIDKQSQFVLRDLGGRKKSPKIFLLGESEIFQSNDEDTDPVTESFVKPLRLGHFLGRLHFHFQPARAQSESMLFGGFRLEPALRHVVAEPDGTVIRLTEKETHLLDYLGRSKQPVAREELLAAIWGYDARIDTHTLETHIYRLRRKLDPEGTGIETILAAPGSYALAIAEK